MNAGCRAAVFTAASCVAHALLFYASPLRIKANLCLALAMLFFAWPLQCQAEPWHRNSIQCASFALLGHAQQSKTMPLQSIFFDFFPVKAAFAAVSPLTDAAHPAVIHQFAGKIIHIFGQAFDCEFDF